ncbi:MAG: hypothetical protein LBQ20_07120 [Rhodanobacter sp.]|jgi:rhodanese-related sulfurtransferase|nr:hypothetical protein [Rhodanobacter sp.]
MIGLLKALFGRAGERIDVQGALRRIDAGAILLDVREADEYAGGHAPSALSLPLSQLRAHGNAAIDRLGLSEKTTDILLICQSGMRSRMAQSILSADTRRRYINVTGGMATWAARGLPLSQK